MNGWLRLTDAEFEQHSCALLDCPDDHFHAEGVEAIVAARLASVKALADEWEREFSEPATAPTHVAAMQVATGMCADRLRAVLGSDAHTEQKGTGE